VSAEVGVLLDVVDVVYVEHDGRTTASTFCRRVQTCHTTSDGALVCGDLIMILTWEIARDKTANTQRKKCDGWQSHIITV